MARPSLYETKVKPKIRFIPPLLKEGFSQKDIADFLGINEDTLYEYKKKHTEFSECFEKKDIIEAVENTYINRLLGKYKATKEIYERNKNGKMVLVKQEKYEIPFNDGAYKHYLALMKPEKWRNTENEDSNIVKEFMKAVGIANGKSEPGNK